LLLFAAAPIGAKSPVSSRHGTWLAAQTIVRGLAVRWHEPEPAAALDFLRELGWREVIAGSARLNEVAARAVKSERARCYLGKGGAAR
jgi:hypothetical protein